MDLAAVASLLASSAKAAKKATLRKNNADKDKAKRGKKRDPTDTDGAESAHDVRSIALVDRPSIVILAYASRPSLRSACTRLSTFLEDAKWAGSVMHDVPTSDAACAAARYSGHNFTAADVERFVQAVESANLQLGDDEAELVRRVRHVVTERANSTDPGDGTVALVAVSATGLATDELASTLVHETMHGIFETESCVRAFVQELWDDKLTARGRAVWRDWLHGLGYNARCDDRLAMNELLAYLSTEPYGRPLWMLGGGRRRGEGGDGSGEPLFEGDPGGGTDGEALTRLRDVFVLRAKDAIPQPHPVAGPGAKARCVWDGARNGSS